MFDIRLAYVRYVVGVRLTHVRNVVGRLQAFVFLEMFGTLANHG